MVASVLAFDRMPVSEIMTPRERISCLSVDDACETRWGESGTHVAVVRGADGRVKGFAALVDVLEAIVGDIPTFEERLRPRPCRGAMVANRPAVSSLAAARG